MQGVTNTIADEIQRNKDESKKMLENVRRIEEHIGEMVKIIIPSGYIMTTCPSKYLDDPYFTILNREEVLTKLNELKK